MKNAILRTVAAVCAEDTRHTRQLLAHFEKVEDNWRLTPRIRQRVRWRRVNLITDLTVMGRFDVIFCRYVLSALDEGIRRRVLEGLAAAGRRAQGQLR